MITKENLSIPQLHLFNLIESHLESKASHLLFDQFTSYASYIREHRSFLFTLPRQIGKSTIISILADKKEDLIIVRNLESISMFKNHQCCSVYNFEKFTKGKLFRYIFLDETELPSLVNAYTIFKDIKSAAIVGLHTK